MKKNKAILSVLIVFIGLSAIICYNRYSLLDYYLNKEHKFFDEQDINRPYFYLTDRAIMLNYYALKFCQSITNSKNPKYSVDYDSVSLNLREKYYLAQFFKSLPKNFYVFILITTNVYTSVSSKKTSNPYVRFSYLKKSNYDTNRYSFGDLFYALTYTDTTTSGIISYCMRHLKHWMRMSFSVMEKIIFLGIGGDSDNYPGFIIQDIFYDFFEYCINKNPSKLKDVAKILDKRPDNEICGFWYCIYDGPHPSNFRDIHDALYNEFRKYNPRVANLMKSTFEKMLLDGERCCPGH